MEFKAAIFDMDGTLVDSLFLWEVIWRELGERFLGDKGFTPKEEDDKAVRTLPLKEAMELIHSKYMLGGSGAELLARVDEILYKFYSESVELKRGARELLEALESRGVKMCVASANAPEFLELALAHCGIDRYFSEVLSCVTVGKGKEQPDIYLLAKEKLNEEAGDICVFEDSLVAIKTADSIGMKTVGIYDKYNFGQDEIRKIANEYIDCGESLARIV